MKWITPDFPALSLQVREKIGALVTTREGGVSELCYQGLNVASHVDDCQIAVNANRAILRDLAGLPSEPYWLNQTHTNDVVEIPYEYRPSRECDASFTSIANKVCCVLTADCLPLLIVNDEGTEVAAIHAGWRGLANNVIANSIAKMRSDSGQLHVYLGPAIGPSAFEVGEEVYNTFCEKHSGNSACFESQVNGKYFADIYQLAKLELSLLGVTNISGGEYCTVSDVQRFYSYRRDGQTGRMASLIWIKP